MGGKREQEKHVKHVGEGHKDQDDRRKYTEAVKYVIANNT
jgi:hypothetical protein